MHRASSPLAPQRLAGPARPCRRGYHPTLATLVAIYGGVIGQPALGMGIHSEQRVIARSADGQTALHEERQHGPEGGGALTYRLTGPAGTTSFRVSSDFSPGGSSRPQRIAAAECDRRLAELARRLRDTGFSGVAVHPERCHSKPRTSLVTVSPGG